MLHVIGKTYNVPPELLEKVANATFSYLDIKETEVELKFVTEAEITRLNTVYRGKEGPTDVLSFVLDEKPLLGQIFICYNFTKEQAKRLNKKFSDEVALLLVHGLLHIAGFDHEASTDKEKMQGVEKKILERLGIQR